MADLRLSEFSQVEEPFLRQLEGSGWRVLRGDKYDPASTERESFLEVIIESELRAALKQINPWLEDDQVDELVRRIQAPLSTQLPKANDEILGLLLEGQSVSENRQTREGHPNARYLDFSYSANNRFLAVSQFKVKIPGTEKHIIPDIVLFVNGLPLVVVECKSPVVSDPLGEAMEQLQRYANQRGMIEGNEKLFGTTNPGWLLSVRYVVMPASRANSMAHTTHPYITLIHPSPLAIASNFSLHLNP